jgi:Zn-dependent protease
VEVLDLEGAPVLLALLVQKVPAWQVLPVWLQEAPAPSDGEPAEEAPVAGTDGLEEVPVAAGAVAPPPPVAARRQPRVGLLTLVAKLGSKLLGGAGKLGAGAVKAAKGTNLAMAAASAASFSLLFNWKVALLLLLQLFIHEYGHLHAMRRTGMRVRGLYFVPFMGALTVSEDAYTSRRQQAYVALSGPLWGGLATAGPLGLFLLTGEPLWAGVASLWAALNLFNLLPFSPLDGGRVLSAFANSYSSGLGVAVTVLGLAGVVALGVAFDFSLIWIVALLGGVELLSEARARAGGRAMRLLPDPDLFQPIHYHHLRAVLGPPPAPLEQAALSRDLVRMAQAARVEPMGARQILGWGLAYAGLAVGLVALVYFTRHLPGGAEVAKILS